MDISTVTMEVRCPECKLKCQTKKVSAVQDHTGNIFIEVVGDCIHLIPHTSRTELVDVTMRIDLRDIKAVFCGEDEED